MKTRLLGQTGIAISEIGLGTNFVGGHNLYENVDEKQGIALVRQAVAEGITFIDTADAYGLGRSEELIGRALGKQINDVVIATKGGITWDEKGNRGPESNAPTYLRKALEASLKRLGRDCVDLYYIHKPDGKTPPEEAFGELMRFKEEGKIRAAGLSNFDISGIEAAMKAGRVDAVQNRYNLFQREVEDELLPFCEKHRISFIPWGPLAFGLLGGKYTTDFKLDENDWRHRTGLFDAEVFAGNVAIVQQLNTLAHEAGAELSHLAIRWILRQGAVGSVIAGAKRPVQVTQNARAAWLELTQKQIAQIEDVLQKM